MIVFEMLMPNHAQGKFHVVQKWEMTPDSTHCVINSYATETREMTCWQDTYTIPLEYPIQSIADIETIMTAPGAPMAGGTIVSDEEETLQTAQARAWARVKAKREKLVNGTLVFDGGEYQIDDRSVDALGNANLTIDDDETVEWTLADNTSVALTSDDIVTVLIGIATYKTRVHAASQSIRRAIHAEGATIETVNAINVDDADTWPSMIGGVEAEPVEDEPEDDEEDQPEE